MIRRLSQFAGIAVAFFAVSNVSAQQPAGMGMGMGANG